MPHGHCQALSSMSDAHDVVMDVEQARGCMPKSVYMHGVLMIEGA